jgi:tRNA1Val (adenine37-N6)-methyltransferase
MPEHAKSDETLDLLCNEKVRLIQKKRGYRLSIDPLLLANFITLKKHETLLDVGTGCGIIPIYLSLKGWRNRFVGIEIQDELYELAVRNRALNNCMDLELIKGDIRALGGGLGCFHVIACNPPFVKERTGKKSPGASRLLARSETSLDLPALAAVASSRLFSRGRLYVVYPAKRLAEVFYELKNRRLEPKRLRLVHSRAGEPAVLCLVECVKNGGTQLRVEPPLYIFSGDDYTQEVRSYYA